MQSNGTNQPALRVEPNCYKLANRHVKVTIKTQCERSKLVTTPAPKLKNDFKIIYPKQNTIVYCPSIQSELLQLEGPNVLDHSYDKTIFSLGARAKVEV